MNTAGVREEWSKFEPIERWFRALDQRRIDKGDREWMLQVTGIVHDEDGLWIQIADDSRCSGSVLLRVRATTSVTQAVRALKSIGARSSFPRVSDLR